MIAVRSCGAVALAIAVFATLGIAEEKATPPAVTSRVDFTRQIRPLLSDRCFRCHGPDASRRKAKLRLDLREGAFKKLDGGWAVVKPGDPSKSELVRRITTDDTDDMMPPPESKLSLTDEEKALLTRWVAEGAEYRPHWSLAPVAAITVPPRAGTSTSSNPIDAFVRARLEQEGLSPSPPASPEVLVRRLAFDLTGLPPSVEDIEAFAADRSEAAYEALIDRYLASPAYGERMAMDWLDLARYADTYGYQADVERDMSPYRDWVISAFNRNLPYDQFLTWQLAGDLLPNASREQTIATAFNRLHRQTNEGGSIEEEFRAEYVVDRVNTFGTSMLGLTIECARCHDHRFDPITQRDYYSLFAFFNNIDESGLYSHFTNATPSPSLLLWTPPQEQERQRLVAEMRAIELDLEKMRRSAKTAFDAEPKPPTVTLPKPIVHLAFDTVDGDKTPDSATGTLAELKDAPVLTNANAVRFSGDNSIVHPGAPILGRTDPFSLALRLQRTEPQDRAVVVHQSRAWTDAGSRGFELTLDHGRVFFGLIHFWPGNAVAVRSRQPLPLGVWSTVAITYDGSSRASGIKVYVNGVAIETEVVRDHLYKDITYDRAAGDNVNEQPRLTIGARFRDSGFKNGLVDDLQIFDVELTAVEVAELAGTRARASAAFDHFLTRRHQPSIAARAELKKRRVEGRLIPPRQKVIERCVGRRACSCEFGDFDAGQLGVEDLQIVDQPVLEAAVPEARADRQPRLLVDVVPRRFVVRDVLVEMIANDFGLNRAAVHVQPDP